MAGRIIDAVSQTVASVSGTTITVSDTTGFYENAYGYLRKTGQPGAVIRVYHVLSSTQLQVREVKDPLGASGVIQSDTDYRLMDASAYATTGVIALPEQVVENHNDAPLT